MDDLLKDVLMAAVRNCTVQSELTIAIMES